MRSKFIITECSKANYRKRYYGILIFESITFFSNFAPTYKYDVISIGMEYSEPNSDKLFLRNSFFISGTVGWNKEDKGRKIGTSGEQ